MSRKIFLALACGLAVIAASTPVATATTIATWTFESVLTPPGPGIGPLAPEVGAGVATAFHASPGAFTTPSGNGSAQSYSSNSWTVGDYYQFQVSTLGESGIEFAWDQTRSSSGPGFGDTGNPNFKLQYGTDGVNYTDHVNYLVPVITWSSSTPDATLTTSFSADLSAVTALDNQGSVYFRLTSILPDQATSTTGTSRVDNISVTSIPEPASLVLGAAGLVAMGFKRRRGG